MWKSNLLVSNFHTHPPGIRNHRFTKINKRTSNENHQRDPFQKSSNYIYIIHIYIPHPPKKKQLQGVVCWQTRHFPLKKKKDSKYHQTTILFQHTKLRVWNPKLHLSGDMRRCDAQGIHVTSRLNHTQPFTEDRHPGGKVARWFRLEDHHSYSDSSGSALGWSPPIYKAMKEVRPFREENNPILRGLINHEYSPLTNWDDPPSRDPML